MRKLLILISVFIYIAISYSQDSVQNQKELVKQTQIKSTVNCDYNLGGNENINHSGEINLRSDKQSLIEFIFPSLIAFIIGGLAFYGTIISSKRQLKSNKEALEKQTESSLEIAKLDFRKSVLSSNRQAWINELRKLISELISLIDLNMLDPSNIKSEDSKRINFLILKAELMLNPNKDIAYIESILEVKNLIFDLSMDTIDGEKAKGYLDVLKKHTKNTQKTHLKLNGKE